MNKQQRLAYAKSVDADKKTVTAHVSTYEWDRTLEKFSPGAWDLTNFKKNPVVLWGHDSSEPPIGRAVDIQETADGLMAVAEFDMESERGAEVFGLFQRGFLNAFSVGFIPKDSIQEAVPGKNTKGTVWTEAELLEFSAVSIPANPGATVNRELGELVVKCLGAGAVTQSEDGESYFVNIPEMAGKPKSDFEKMESALNEIITFARIVKGKPLDVSRLALMGTATSVLNEIITENDVLPAEEIEKLHNVVKELGGVIRSVTPESDNLVSKVLENIRKAL